jgi:hypothetical protein
MTWASPKVEINFKTSLVAADNWIDVTADIVSSISIKRGRQSELDTYSAGTCSFDLINRNRNYDFTYAAGPYFGKLLPRNECRVTATFGSSVDWDSLTLDWDSLTTDWDAIIGTSPTYNLFRGFIQGWPQSYDNLNQMSTVKINAIDRFDLLAQTKLVSGAATSYLKSLVPDFWFRSVFPNGVDNSDDPTKIIKLANDERASQVLKFDYDSWANASDGNPIQADVVGKSVGRMPNFPFPSTVAGIASVPGASRMLNVSNTWSMGGWFRTRTVADQANTFGSASMMKIGGSLGGGAELIWVWSGLPVGVNTRLRASFKHITGGFISTFIDCDSNLADDTWHHVVVTNAPFNFALYVDGNQVGSNNALGSATLDDTVGIVISQSVEWNGWFYDIFGFNRTLSQTEITNLYQAGINLPNQVSGARINSLLTLFGLTGIPTSIANGESIVADAGPYIGSSMLDILQEVATAEDGQLFVDAAGTLVFRGRLDTLTQTRSTTLQATFDDSGSNIPYLEATPTLDIQFMYNQVNTSIAGGTEYQSNDTVNQSAYGVRSLDRTNLSLRNENDAIGQAQWDLAKYATPKARLPFVTIDPRVSNAAMTAALSLTLLDRIRVARTPQNVGSSWSFDAHIEGIEMDIDLPNLDWKITYNLTQTAIVTGYMQLDSSTSGRLDTAKLAG